MIENQNGRWDKVSRIWEIIDSLRGEPGCPWDRKQTPESVQTYLIEEAHEAAAAVRDGQTEEASDELGDLLFMVFFLIHLYEERGSFKLEEVCNRICEKMIRRHPHVFGDLTVNSTEEVRENWEKIKAGEKASAGKKSDGVPRSLPALMRAYRTVSRLSHGDGMWNDLAGRSREYALMNEGFLDRLAAGDSIPPETFGDLMLAMVNLARLAGYRAEDCLHQRLLSLDSNRTGNPDHDGKAG